MPLLRNNNDFEVSLYNGKEDYYLTVAGLGTLTVNRAQAEFAESYEGDFNIEIDYDPDATPVTNASAASAGITKLSAAPVAAGNPIAVGDNDTRMLSSQNKTDVLAHVAAISSDPHGVLPLIPKSSTTVLGTVKLSAAPTDADSPVAVGTNDAGLLTSQNKTDVLAHVAAIDSDPHGVIAQVGNNQFAQLYVTGTGTNPGKYSVTVVDGALVATLVV